MVSRFLSYVSVGGLEQILTVYTPEIAFIMSISQNPFFPFHFPSTFLPLLYMHFSGLDTMPESAIKN